MTAVDIRHVTRRYGDLLAVDDVSLQIDSGEFFTLLGPSGCGKTTLLRLIAGFEAADGGQIFLDRQDMADIAPEQRALHTVFQSYALFPHMTVADNIAFPLRMRAAERGAIRARVQRALADVRLPQMAARYPDELSGGQRQRVAIARTLVDEPKLLLLDEPLAALDLKLREQMRVELIKLQRQLGITFVYVTHDQSEALAMSQRIAVMNEGRLIQIDTPAAIYEFPQTRFVADFIGHCNLLAATVAALDAGSVQLDITGVGAIAARIDRPLQIGQRGVLALRPEKLHIAAAADQAAGNCLSAVIRQQLYLGDVTRYLLEVRADVTLEVLLPNATADHSNRLAVGDRVAVGWPPDAGWFIEAEEDSNA
jgi:spermidine/putrescine transport system ATP-binding protein